MLRKIEHDALTADLSAVEALLVSRTEEDDPIGFLQFTSRKQELVAQLAQFDAQRMNHAQLGIYFGGGPVQGSRGIKADFAGKALDDLQTMVTKRYCEGESGQLKQRGRLPNLDRSKLLVTHAMRGSFGFVLEEAGDTAEILDTPLHQVVAEVTDILAHMGSADEEIFESAALAIDPRFLFTLRQFFVRLDESEATLRLVNREKDFLLDRRSVALARSRVQEMHIDERDEQYVGTLLLLPTDRRFEFRTRSGKEELTLTGSVSSHVSAQLDGQGELGTEPIDVRYIPQHPWRVEIRTREIKERNRAPRKVHSLLRLIERASFESEAAALS